MQNKLQHGIRKAQSRLWHNTLWYINRASDCYTKQYQVSDDDFASNFYNDRGREERHKDNSFKLEHGLIKEIESFSSGLINQIEEVELLSPGRHADWLTLALSGFVRGRNGKGKTFDRDRKDDDQKVWEEVLNSTKCTDKKGRVKINHNVLIDLGFRREIFVSKFSMRRDWYCQRIPLIYAAIVESEDCRILFYPVSPYTVILVSNVKMADAINSKIVYEVMIKTAIKNKLDYYSLKNEKCWFPPLIKCGIARHQFYSL